MRQKYVMILAVVGILIVLPATVARACGASISLLATMAAIQLFALLPFLLTAPVSLVLGVRAAVKKEWKKAGVLAIGACIPIITWCIAAFLNDPGWEAVMGI